MGTILAGIDQTRLYSTIEAAPLLGVCTETARKMCATGALDGATPVSFDSRNRVTAWRIPGAVITAYQARMAKAAKGARR